SKQEGRKHPRATADVYVNKIIGDEPHLARVRDISAGGVYLYRLLEPQNHDVRHVGLEIMLPGARDVIWAVGEVLRDDHHDPVGEGVAVRFVRIAESDREQ